MWLLDVDHPVDTELIGQHAKALGPEGGLERHGDAATQG